MNDPGLMALVARNGAGAGVWTLVLIALITLIKGWPALRKLSIEADGSLRKDLMQRISTLEVENRALHAEIAGLHRQMITMQLVTGQPIPLEKMAPATAEAAARLADMVRADLAKAATGNNES